MDRAVLLPTPGDPFITAAWIASYKRFVQKHIDRLYVCINSPVEDVIFEYVVNQFERIDAEVVVERKFIDHGPAITKLVNLCKEDTILLLEDDFYIQDRQCVNNWFKVVESGKVDMVGSMRGSCSPELCLAVSKNRGLVGKEKLQSNFWPCLFVGKTKDLNRTDKNFGGKRFPAGTYIPELGVTPKKDWAGDTFVWASVQLRMLGLTVCQVDQGRLIDVLRKGDMAPRWLHIGSGSSSLNGHLLDKNMSPVGRRKKIVRNFPLVPDLGIKEHFERKFSWWAVLNEAFPIPTCEKASFFNQEYREAISRTVNACGLNKNKMLSHQSKFTKMIGQLL